mgnify:CR=1 FL=1
MKKKLGEPCPLCYRKITDWVFKEAYRRKVENARLSTKKAIANNNHRNNGRKPKLTEKQKKEIKEKYYIQYNRPSMRSLAKSYGVSCPTISKVLKSER